MDLSSLETLLELWTDAHDRGREVAVADLCRHRPELQEELRIRIAEYRRVNELVHELDGHVVTVDDVNQTVYPPLPRHPVLREEPPAVPGYEIVRELGRGGMGVVYLARDVERARLVALKMLLNPHGVSAEAVRAFRHEAETMAQLSHPGTVRIYEVGEVSTARGGRVPYASMEYCAGGSLQEVLANRPLTDGEAARIVEALARTMHAVHEAGVVHRDLKPGNVLLAVFGVPCSVFRKEEEEIKEAASGQTTEHRTRNTVPKITDFGVSKRLDAIDDATDMILGTPSYMAPEQADGRHTVGVAADVWALGAILYECLTGLPPFLGESVLGTLIQVTKHEPVAPRQLNPFCPLGLERIALKCLQKDPRRRYPSARDLANDLARFHSASPVVATPSSRITMACPNGLKA